MKLKPKSRAIFISYFLIAALPVAIDLVSMCRLSVFKIENENSHKAYGEIRQTEERRQYGRLLHLITQNERIEFSCRLPGLSRYSQCLRDTSFDGQAAEIQWVVAPSGFLFDQARYPIKISLPNGENIYTEENAKQRIKTRIKTMAFISLPLSLLLLLGGSTLALWALKRQDKSSKP